MIQKPRLANPLATRQAPDFKALNHTTTLVVESKQLATPPEAQQYFEPGVNTKLNRRRKPKVDFTLPSDMPKYPLGFVPINQTPGANGEEPAEIKVKEGVPADLMDMFAKISAHQEAESKAVEAAKVAGRMDVGTLIAQQLLTTLKEVNTEAKISSLMKKGFTEGEAVGAVQTLRMEDAVREAKLPPPPESVETVLAAQFPAAPAAVAPPAMEFIKVPRLSKAEFAKVKGDVTEDEKAEMKRLEREGKKTLARVAAGLPHYELPEEVAIKQGAKDVAGAIRQAMARKSKEGKE